jgi:hypothetical protein
LEHIELSTVFHGERFGEHRILRAGSDLANRSFGRVPADDKVKSLSPNHRFVIALRSPGGVVDTGLRTRPSEKKTPRTAC